jgi:hypothetical protein
VIKGEMGPIASRAFGAALILCALPVLRIAWRAIDSGRLPKDIFRGDVEAGPIDMLDDPFGFWFPTAMMGLGGLLGVAVGTILIVTGEGP